MYNSFLLFQKNIEQTKELSHIYSYLQQSIITPLSFDDILRSQIVYSVSAFDKLIHDVIKVGMVKIFMGNRPQTPKYLSEPISLSLHGELNAATIPPKEYIFEQAIHNKLKTVSYQDPTKIAEGLSFIWDEKQKWQKISANLGMSDKDTKTKLKLITSKRNAIVHEAGIDPMTNQKHPISQQECDDITGFLYSCGNEIYKLVS